MAFLVGVHPADIESFYVAQVDALATMGINELSLSDECAADLAHDVLMAALGQSHRMPADTKAWLRGAMVAAARHTTRDGQ